MINSLFSGGIIALCIAVIVYQIRQGKLRTNTKKNRKNRRK